MIKKRRKKGVLKPAVIEAAAETLASEDGVQYVMDGWEDDFNYSDMEGLFFIVKGQYDRVSPVATVRNGMDYKEIHLGGYDPERGSTAEHYCVYDKVTFHCTYGGSSLEDALKNVKRTVRVHKNSPESYFRYVSEVTNEDFYYRRFEGSSPFTEAQFKRVAEDGKSWKVSEKMKMHLFAVMKRYGFTYEPFVEEAYEAAVKDLREASTKVKERAKKGRRKVKLKR